jgi:hypothetical protein
MQFLLTPERNASTSAAHAAVIITRAIARTEPGPARISSTLAFDEA